VTSGESNSLEASLRRTAAHARRNRANYDPRVIRFCSLFQTRRWLSLEFIDWLERRRR
jgi:hypothetical protein